MIRGRVGVRVRLGLAFLKNNLTVFGKQNLKKNSDGKKYDFDGGLKSLFFCIRVVLNLDQKSYQLTLITYVLNIFCFLAREKLCFF